MTSLQTRLYMVNSCGFKFYILQLTHNHFLVAGEAKRFLEITEAEQELMTPEEYEAYAELMVQLS